MANRNIRDILGGLLMLGIGLFFAIYGRNYELGTVARMGAGYFPVVLGWVLAAFGVLIILPALRQPFAPMQFALSNFFWVILALGVFAWGLPRLGLVAAAFAACVIAGVADKSFSWPMRFLIAVGVTVLTVLIFKFGLNMVLPLWWWER